MVLLAKTGWDRLGEDLADLTNLGDVLLTLERLAIAALLGGLLGYERERIGKAAGLRTHMLVAVGSAFFVIPSQLAGDVDLGRVIQGIVAGIGFIGGGAILKLADEKKIKGLTTAADIWLAAAIGVAAGLGKLGAAVVCTLVGFVILSVLYRLDRSIGTRSTGEDAWSARSRFPLARFGQQVFLLLRRPRG
jgi:putative Mg2+ transporter-C (MgtC) family protein